MTQYVTLQIRGNCRDDVRAEWDTGCFTLKVIHRGVLHMALQGRGESFQAVIKRNHRSGEKQKGLILSEFCANTGSDRSYAIRLLSSGFKYYGRKPGKPSSYNTGDYQLVLARLWFGAQVRAGNCAPLEFS